MTSIVSYLGNLRTSCVHLKSGQTIHTDAPVDNEGLGEAFSPTDLVATAYASCMLTIMGIYCANHGVLFNSGEVEVEKIMASNPRRIGKIVFKFDLKANLWDEKTAKKVIAAGKACPVALTLSKEIAIEFEFLV